MPEDNSAQAGQGQAPTGQQQQQQTSQTPSAGQAPATPPTNPPAGADGNQQQAQTPASDGLSDADLRKIITDLRRENATHRTRLKTFEDAQKAAEDAKLDEAQKAAKRADEAERAAATFRTALATAKLENAAIRANALDSDAVVALLAGKLEYDDATGQPTNVDALLTELAKSKPHLFTGGQQQQQQRSQASAGAAMNPSRTAGTQAPLSWELISSLPPEQYNARRAEILSWMQSNPRPRR